METCLPPKSKFHAGFGLPWIMFGLASISMGLGGLRLLVKTGSGFYDKPTFGWLCVFAIFLGFFMFKGGWRRYRGVLVEKSAIRRVNLPRGWIKEANVTVSHGDLDLLVTNPDGVRFAVEVKTYQGASVKRSLFGNSEELVYPDGRKFSQGDPVSQTLRNAEEKDAVPILWLPLAPNKKAMKMRCGVTVVQGNPRQLKRAMGIGFW
jgi:hypothetical protein